MTGEILVTHPLLGTASLLGWPIVTKMLYSEGGAKLLMSGLRVPLKATPTAGIIAGSILRAAGPGAKPIELPMAAQDQQPAPETAMAGR